MRLANSLVIMASCVIGLAPPAVAQAYTGARPAAQDSGLPASITRMRTMKPGFINNLAALRTVAITNSQGQQLKTKPLNAFLGGLTGPRPNHPAAIVLDTGSEFGIKPVAHVPRSQISMETVEISSGSLIYQHLPSMESVQDRLVVHSGEFLFSTTAPVALQLPGASMQLLPDTLVKVRVSDQSSSVINLLDRRRHSVVMKICRRTLVLKPGQECRFSLDKEKIARNCSDGCGRRAHKDASCCRYTIVLSEISVAALLKHDVLGRQLYTSRRKSHRKLSDDILKMAASLALSTKNKEPYRWD